MSKQRPTTDQSRSTRELLSRARRGDWGAVFIMVLALWLIFSWSVQLIWLAVFFLFGRTDPFIAKPITVALMASVAAVLFWVRSTYRLFYGSMEIAFGLWSCWNALGPTRDPLPDLSNKAIMVAAVYVVVRGFVNVKEARD